MRTTLLAFATVLAFAPAADAKCAFYGLTAEPLGGKDVTIASDGGILVAAVPVQGGGSLDRGDVAVQPKWRLRVKKDAVVPTVETIAPGLAVYRTTGARELALEDDGGKAIGKARVASGPAAPRLAAPKVKAATFSGSHGGKRPWGRLVVQIDGSVPAGAVAIVVADEKGVGRSWGKIAPGEQLVAYQSYRCQVLPNGTVESPPGDKIVLMWVDASGRKSAASAPIVVGGKLDGSDDDDP